MANRSRATWMLCLWLLAVAGLARSGGAAPSSEQPPSVMVGLSILPSPHTLHLILRVSNSARSSGLTDLSSEIPSYPDGVFSIPSLPTERETIAELKRLAQRELIEDVTLEEAVVAVAYSSDEQRSSLRDAASAAGLTVRRIINRPTSACIAYGLDKETLYRAAADWAPWGRAVVVVDVLGGFEEEVQAEVSLLDIDDGVFEILSRRERRIEVGSATLVPMLEEVLHEANTSASRVDDWLLVGDTSLAPNLSAVLSTFFPSANSVATISIPPELAAAYGAATQAAVLSGDSDVWLGNFSTTARSLGVETSNGVVHRLIPRHSILPRRVETTFTTTEDNQSAASLRLFEGEFPAEGNRLLGVLELDGLTPAPAGDLELLVSLEVSDWYTSLNLTIQDLTSGRSSTLELPISAPIGTEWNHIEEMILKVEEEDVAREQRGESKPEPSRAVSAELPPPLRAAKSVDDGRGGRFKDEL